MLPDNPRCWSRGQGAPGRGAGWGPSAGTFLPGHTGGDSRRVVLPGCAVWLLCQLAMDPGRSEEKGAPSQAVLPLAAASRKKLHFCGAASLGLARGSQAGSAQAHCPSCPKLASPWPPTCLWPHSSPVPKASLAQRGEGSQHRHEGSAWTVCTDHRLQTFQVPDSLQILPPCTLPHAQTKASPSFPLWRHPRAPGTCRVHTWGSLSTQCQGGRKLGPGHQHSLCGWPGQPARGGIGEQEQ